ncbi:MAG: dihydrolipoyl dehydrogenase [Planctomycetes bacterium]|nr:dihydrolipoyl dehydrogenase [Planctomycetota bacterium]
MPKSETQLAVIGGGPGGYAAAFHAAEAGMRTVLVEQNARLGGVCLNRGCIPSKALLHVARLIGEAAEAPAWGVSFGQPEIEIEKLREWKSGIVGRLSGGIAELAKRRGIEVRQARASFVDSRTLRLEGPEGAEETLRFEHAVLATGSSPAMPGIFDIGDRRVMDSTGALELENIPSTLLVIGGGYIGLEMGTVYAALGSRVTCVELTPGLLPGVDRDLVRPLQKRLARMFESIHLETKVESLKAAGEGIVCTLSGKDVQPEIAFERVLVAVGRRPNSRGLGLEATRVEVLPSGFVKVDERGRTADPRILAIGDVAGEPMLAHKATREARVAVEALAGEPAAFDNAAIPAVVFTDPEIAWCGVTETQAAAEGREIQVSRFPWAASGRALTLGRTEGVTKIIVDPETQRVIGAGIVGPGAGELIAEATLAVEMAAVARDVADTIHAHPTLAETFAEAAEAITGAATHLYRPKAEINDRPPPPPPGRRL